MASSVAHIPTSALIAAFGEDWFDTLSQASPSLNFDNIVKSKKVSKPKLSPCQRSSLSFDSDKCHARCIAIKTDEQGNPLYRKKGNVHPGLIDFQCSASHKDGLFCAKHSSACGGGGNLGSFKDDRPETIEGYGGEKFEGHIWLWAEDPQSDQYKITEKSSKKNPSKKASSKSSISYDEQEWSNIIQDSKMKKDLAICYLQHHGQNLNDDITGKMYTIGQLRALVRNHYAEASNDESSPRPQESSQDETLQRDDERYEASAESEQRFIAEQTPQDNAADALLAAAATTESPEQTAASQNDDDDASDAAADDDEDYDEITFEGITYKVDGFKDVYNPEDMYHLGTLTSEDPIEIDWVTREARFLHMTNVEDNK